MSECCKKELRTLHLYSQNAIIELWNDVEKVGDCTAVAMYGQQGALSNVRMYLDEFGNQLKSFNSITITKSDYFGHVVVADLNITSHGTISIFSMNTCPFVFDNETILWRSINEPS